MRPRSDSALFPGVFIDFPRLWSPFPGARLEDVFSFLPLRVDLGVVNKTNVKESKLIFKSEGSGFSKIQVEASFKHADTFSGVKKGDTIIIEGTVSNLELPGIESGVKVFGPSRTVELTESMLVQKEKK